MLPPFLVAAAVWLIVINAAAAGMYAWDKRSAQRGSRRISEAKLLAASALGGWPAAILVGRKLRHKTSKVSYRIKFAVAVIVNLTLVGGLVWLALR